jgi:hypothetical protein
VFTHDTPHKGLSAQWSDTSRHELTGANGGEIEIRERSNLDRARRIAYILSQAAATKAEG